MAALTTLLQPVIGVRPAQAIDAITESFRGRHVRTDGVRPAGPQRWPGRRGPPGGLAVSERGRISAEVIRQYQAAR
jgi:hypothetical protein